MNLLYNHPIVGLLTWLGGLGISFTSIEPILQALALLVGILAGFVTMLIKIEDLRTRMWKRREREREQRRIELNELEQENEERYGTA